MAGKKTGKKNESAPPKDSNILAAILASVQDLYEAHAREIVNVREESAGQAIVVSFSHDIDCSDSAPKVTSKISFASRVTDKRTKVLDDPNQGTFQEMVEETAQAELGEKRKPGRPKKAKPDETVVEVPPAE